MPAVVKQKKKRPKERKKASITVVRVMILKNCTFVVHILQQTKIQIKKDTLKC